MKKIILLSILVIFASCGSRKVQKSVVKENSTTEKTETEKKDIETKTETNTVINDESNEIEVTPIDTSKAIIVNGKEYKNAIVTLRKKKVNTVIEKKEIVKDNSAKTVKAVAKTKKDNKDIAIERKSNPFLPLLWLLIPAIGYLIWKYKYKLIRL